MIETIGSFEKGTRTKHKQKIHATGFDGEGHGGFWYDFASIVVRMNGDGQDTPEGIDLLNLILAAPDLLKALKIMINNFTDCGDTSLQCEALETARAAYDKAKGIS